MRKFRERITRISGAVVEVTAKDVALSLIHI